MSKPTYLNDEQYSNPLVLRDVTLKYPEHLFEPDEKYGSLYALVVIPKDRPVVEKLKQKIQDLFQENFPGHDDWASPLKDGDLKDDPGYKDSYYMYIKTDAKNPPVVVDENKQPTTLRDGKIRHNCKVHVKFCLKAYGFNNSYGVTTKLITVKYSSEPDCQPQTVEKQRYQYQQQNEYKENKSKDGAGIPWKVESYKPVDDWPQHPDSDPKLEAWLMENAKDI